MTEKRIHLNNRPAGYAGSVLIGATFAAGWTPCVGPVLGTMLMYASTTDTLTDGVTLLAFYSLGLGLPLFAAAMGVDRFLASFKRVRRYQEAVSAASGLFLIIFGLIIYSDSFTLLTSLCEEARADAQAHARRRCRRRRYNYGIDSSSASPAAHLAAVRIHRRPRGTP